MDFQLSGGSPSSSSTTFSSSSDLHRHSNNSHSWWDSISKARSRIHLLLSLLPSSAAPLSSLADSDRPARSLLLSSDAYSSHSAALSSASSGAADDPLCHWLYDTFLSSDADLRLVVTSYLPVISAAYLRRVHHLPAADFASLCGFEAVLLAVYSSETRARNGKSVTVSIPDLSEPSLYHSPRIPIKSSKRLIGVLSPSLEPQMAVKFTKRASIIGVALDCYYKQISQMPNWSKLDFCKFASVWAAQNCPCTSENPNNFFQNNIENVVERVDNLDVEDDRRIPLPWELLQPILRILGHCLLGPLNAVEVKDAASMAIRCLYARATHDLVPQAILATRSLIQLDPRV